ncbi:hypothetical protein P3S67_022017 [Capsicum chacoense]
MDEEEKQPGSDPQLSEMKARLDKLEDTLKENVVESKKQSGELADKPIDNGVEKEDPMTQTNEISRIYYFMIVELSEGFLSGKSLILEHQTLTIAFFC